MKSKLIAILGLAVLFAQSITPKKQDEDKLSNNFEESLSRGESFVVVARRDGLKNTKARHKIDNRVVEWNIYGQKNIEASVKDKNFDVEFIFDKESSLGFAVIIPKNSKEAPALEESKKEPPKENKEPTKDEKNTKPVK